jgi:TrmH family RNA methyltransferase
MISKADIKLISALDKKKERIAHNLFVVEGEKMVKELLDAQFPTHKAVHKLQTLYYTLHWKEKNMELLEDVAAEKVEVTPSEMQKISGLNTPPGVLATVKIPAYRKSGVLEGLVLMLDGVRDPGNLGAIIRCADWFNIKHIYCSGDTVDLYNPKVVQSTMGSIFRVEVHFGDLPTIIKTILHDNPMFPIYGATLQGDNVYTLDLVARGVIILGSESHGLSPEVHKLVTKEIMIPRFGAGESLNVALATAILCSEFKRY